MWQIADLFVSVPKGDLLVTFSTEHGFKGGQELRLNGKYYRVVRVDSATTMTIRRWRWYNRLWLWVKGKFGYA